MGRTDRSTLVTTGNTSSRTQARLLTVILSYDDLLADVAQTVRLFPRTSLRIGRAEEGVAAVSDGEDRLALADGRTSASHATIRSEPTFSVLIDEKSRNGTFLNGMRLESERPLSDGDLLELGHTLLCFRVVDEAQADRVLAGRPCLLGPTRTHSPEVAALSAELDRVAPTGQSVLILGETGTGKEVVAQEVHARSGRRGALRAIDCGAIPDPLFESTFFGHRRNAFTGAETRTGELALSDGGTLFLDEVANLSPEAQAKLLRVLEERKVTPLGGTESLPLDLRVVAATNRDLYQPGTGFRADLLQRVAGYVAKLPPLARRREDLGLLAAHLLRQVGVTRAAIRSAAGRALFGGPLPGNIRQLREALRTAAALAGDGPIELEHLPPLGPSSGADTRYGDETRPSESPEPPELANRQKVTAPGGVPVPDAASIEQALEAAGGNMVQAARQLGTSPRQLYRWVERLQISLERFRGGA